MTANARPNPTAPFLHAYPVDADPPEMRPGTPQRAWMDKTEQRTAYRCLPLAMANSSGWELLCPFELRIDYNGGRGVEAIKLSSPDRKADVARLATSHFRDGIVTFHTGYLFRTAPGWAVWTMAPPNRPKDGINALSGLVETDWLPFPFTMNWKMTRPGRVRFQKGEPFAFLTLMPHTELDAVQPRLKSLADDPELARDYRDWQHSRAAFMARLQARDRRAEEAGWQRNYMRGEKPLGGSAHGHITKRRLKPLE